MFEGFKRHTEGIAAALAISTGAAGAGAATGQFDGPDDSTQKTSDVTPNLEKSALINESAPDLNLSDPKFSFSLSSHYASRYTAIGQVLDDGPSLHSNARLTFPTEHGDLFFNLWNHTPLTKRDGGFQEVDLNVGVSKTFGDFQLTLDHGSFFFPDSDIPTMHQVSGEVDWSNQLIPVSGKISFNHTTNDLRGELTAYKPIRISDELTLIPSASIGAALMANTLYDKEGFTDAKIGVTAEWRPKESPLTLYGGIERLESFTHSDASGFNFILGFRRDF